MDVSCNPFFGLPIEVLCHLVTFMEIDDIYSFSKINRNNYETVNSLINTEYVVYSILKREFSKKYLPNALCKFMNKVTAHQNIHWMKMFVSTYNKDVLPQRNIMLVWSNYDFLVDSIIKNDLTIITYLFSTYNLQSAFLSTVFDRLKHHNEIEKLNSLVSEAKGFCIWIDSDYPNNTDYKYGYNWEISDIQINLYALPFIFKQYSVGLLMLDLLKKRDNYFNSYMSKEVFTVWLPADFRYIGSIKDLMPTIPIEIIA